MSDVTVTKVKDANFGNCVKISNSIVELLVTIDYGPRVIHFSRVGMENMFYQDLAKGNLGDKQDVFDSCLKLYGGHRIWISPEILPRCYYPDEAAVEVVEIEDGAEFIAPVEAVNNIQKIMRITLIEDAPVVKLLHTIRNCGVWDIELAPWCITMMDKGGTEVIPMPERKTGLLMNRNISLWDYSEMNDSRVYWGKDYITLRQNPDKSNPFKLGINNEAGWSAYFNKGQVFFKFFEPEVDGAYPDNGCCFETFTNDVMLEIESLGETAYIMPGECVTHEEEWELYEASDMPSNDESEIKSILEKYI